MKSPCPWNEETCLHAATNGHLDVLQWAIENGCPRNEWICHCAAEKGHLHGNSFHFEIYRAF